MATVDNILNVLVPIHLEVMVVNGNLNTWKDVSLSINKLSVARYGANGALGSYLEKDPDANGKAIDPKQPVIQNGVHLHWVMPDAMRKGKHTANGSLDFPAVPNRWFIVRTSKKGDVKSWVLQSDFQQSGTTAYNYIKENDADNSLEAIAMGKAWELKDWNEDGTKTAVKKLTIMAPGNSEFAASYMHCKNVFGFCDDMKDAQGEPLAAGNAFTYQVYGWYANKTDDPLNNTADIKARLAELSWALEDETGIRNETGFSTVLYATVHSVLWQKKPESNIPSQNIKIGIGNTVSEALASVLINEIAILNDGIPNKLLAAYQYKSLVDNGLEGDGLEILKKKVHSKSFLPVEAGTVWVVQPPEQEPGDNRKKEPEVRGFDAFSWEVSQSLLKLNQLQNEYNVKADLLAAEQANLYALKYKKVFSGTNQSGQFIDKDKWNLVIDEIEENITQTITNINTLGKRLGQLMTRPAKGFGFKPAVEPIWPQDYIGEIAEQYYRLLSLMKDAKMDGFEAKRIAAPQYYEPVDPAVVITGINPPKKYVKSTANNLKAAQGNGGKLKCRTKYLLPNRLYNGDQFINSADIYSKVITPQVFALMRSKGIPEGVESLMNEALLLNPLLTEEIARIAHWDNIAEVFALISNYQNTPAAFKQKEDLLKAVCLPPADAVAKWSQPWLPLYLEWGVSWAQLQPGKTEDILQGWAFGNGTNLVDFKSHASLKNYKGLNETSYYGRTLLSSQFADKVKSLNTTINGIFKGQKNIFNNFEPMAQTLGGFSSQLIQRYNGVQLPIVNPVNKQLIVDPAYELIANQNSWRPIITGGQPFNPVRAGTMRITTLRVIDAFGQVLNVKIPATHRGGKKELLTSSAGMRHTAGPPNVFELAPRIIQPARLKFDWVSAGNATRVTDSDPGTSPVAGWLLYNALDKHLMVYHPSGVELGYFVKTAKPKKNAGKGKAVTEFEIILLPPPVSSPRPIGVINQTLFSVMNFIRLNANNFDGVCKQIESVTKKIQAKYSRQQLTMALPTGFPIAVLNAQFLIEMKGLKAQGQAWEGNQPFDKIKYGVTIGSAANKTDGLVGYFVNENYKQLMVSAGEENVPLKFKSSLADKFNTEELQKLTILMDPRTMVTITSGLLPMGTFELPQHAIKKALKRINIRVLVAPAITPITSIKIPLYKSNDVNWDFISPLKAKLPLVAEEATGTLTYEEIKATEGWLTLVNNETEIN